MDYAKPIHPAELDPRHQRAPFEVVEHLAAGLKAKAKRLRLDIAVLEGQAVALEQAAWDAECDAREFRRFQPGGSPEDPTTPREDGHLAEMRERVRELLDSGDITAEQLREALTSDRPPLRVTRTFGAGRGANDG